MNRLKTGFLILLVVATSACAPGETTIHRDVVYGHFDGLGLIYDALQPKVQNGAAIVLIQSGAFYSRWRKPEEHLAENAELLDAGYTLFILYHGNDQSRRVERVSEIHRGIRHIRLNAAQYGIDPERIGVTGHSTGGLLALLAGVKSDDGNADSDDEIERTSSHVAAVVASAPPVDFLAFVEGLYDDGPDEETVAQAPEISAHLFVDSNDPPVLLIHGGADDGVPISHSQLMYDTLIANDVPSQLVVVEGGGHNYFGEESGAKQLLEARLDWFGRYLLDE